jgi:hypothetical protein
LTVMKKLYWRVISSLVRKIGCSIPKVFSRSSRDGRSVSFQVVATLKRNKHCTKFQLSMTCPSWSGPRLMSSPLYIYIYI